MARYRDGEVDDTDLMQTGNIGDDYVTVSSKLQDAIDLWEIGARASGGEIVTDPTKSWYCLIDFEWNEGEWSYKSEMDDVDITVKNGDGMRCPLSSIAPSEARRMLGVYLAADGNNTTQVKEMRNTAEVWQNKVRVGHLNRWDAWLALNTTVMKSLEYPLLATTLSIEECTHIMAPILSAGLPNAGMCRNMARSLVYGPSKYQGLDIHNLYTTQGITHLAALVNNIWRDTETGKLMIISLENMKLELGI